VLYCRCRARLVTKDQAYTKREKQKTKRCVIISYKFLNLKLELVTTMFRQHY